MRWPLRRRRSSPAAEVAEAHRLSEALARLHGSRPCTEKRCRERTGMGCEYVDRRNRNCMTAWCPEHRIVMDGKVYCRRHAGVVGALTLTWGGPMPPLPDLENRAPSLANWVARDVDAGVRRLLLGWLDGHGGQLISEPVHLVFGGEEGQRRWERGWKVVAHQRSALDVRLGVAEAADTEVVVLVDGEILGQLVPPWIAHRAEPAAGAQSEREAFTTEVVSLIATRLGLEALSPSRDRRG